LAVSQTTELKGRPETGKLAAGIMTQANNPVSGFRFELMLSPRVAGGDHG